MLAISLLARNYYRSLGEHRSAGEQLRYSESRFKDFAELGADLCWEVDAEMRYAHLCGRHEELMGMPISELLGRSRLDLLADLTIDPAEHEAHLSAIATRQAFENYELSYDNPNGKTVVLSSNGKPVFNDHGQFAGYRGVARNITQTHSLSRRLRYQSTHDPLTDLTNRREFGRRLDRALEQTQTDDSEHVLCFMDLDQFKVVNDTCGHTAGDELLRQLSGLFKQQVRSGDTLARLGGDEFCLLLENCTLDQAQRVLEKLRRAISEYSYEWEGRLFQVGISIGIVPVTRYSGTLEQIMSAADSACYAAKEAGRNRIHVYREGDAILAKRHVEMQWVSRITHALGANRFVLYAQPIVEIEPRVPARESVQLMPRPASGDEPETQPAPYNHLEVLVRMLDEDGQTIPPGAFLPAAERYNLAPKLDKWVIQATFDWLTADRQRLDSLQYCSINLSGNSLGDDDFADFVVDALDHAGIPPDKICFEVTETAAITKLGSATHLMTRLKELGCLFALDDFGSGLSSFGYLKSLPVDFLKIDGQFIRDIVTDPIDFAMVKSINEIGQVMGKKTIAEFVENDEFLLRLRELGVNYAQGYGIGKPLR